MSRRCGRQPAARAALCGGFCFWLCLPGAFAEQGLGAATDKPSVGSGPRAGLTAAALVARGTERFRRGDYDEAIADFYAAYEQQQVPMLLFNIAQAHRKAGRGPDAMTIFEQFKQVDPKSPLLPEVDAYIAELKAKQEAKQAAAERDRTELLARLAEQRAREATALAKALEEERLRSDPNLRSSALQPPPVYKKKWFWGLTAGGAAAAILGATLIGIFARPPALPTTDLPSRRVLF